MLTTNYQPWPNQSPEPTAVTPGRSAIAVRAASRRCSLFLIQIRSEPAGDDWCYQLGATARHAGGVHDLLLLVGQVVWEVEQLSAVLAFSLDIKPVAYNLARSPDAITLRRCVQMLVFAFHWCYCFAHGDFWFQVGTVYSPMADSVGAGGSDISATRLAGGVAEAAGSGGTGGGATGGMAGADAGLPALPGL